MALLTTGIFILKQDYTSCLMRPELVEKGVHMPKGWYRIHGPNLPFPYIRIIWHSSVGLLIFFYTHARKRWILRMFIMGRTNWSKHCQKRSQIQKAVHILYNTQRSWIQREGLSCESSCQACMWASATISEGFPWILLRTGHNQGINYSWSLVRAVLAEPHCVVSNWTLFGQMVLSS